MQFEPYGRMLTRKEVMCLTGLSGGQTGRLTHKYRVKIGCQYVISVQRLKSLIDDGTVEKYANMHGGRPRREG